MSPMSARRRRPPRQGTPSDATTALNGPWGARRAANGLCSAAHPSATPLAAPGPGRRGLPRPRGAPRPAGAGFRVAPARPVTGPPEVG